MTDQKPASIYEALRLAQMDMPKVVKDKTNPHFRSKYSDLAGTADAAYPALHKHGIVIFQPIVSQGNDKWAVMTVLCHAATGERIDTMVPLILGKHDMQGFKSAVTYARRVGLENLTGIAPDDDDGNAAAQQAPRKDYTATPDRDWTEPENPGLSTGVKGANVSGSATPAEKAKAFTDSLIRQMQDARTEKGVDGVWRKNESVIARLRESYEGHYQELLDVDAARRKALTEPEEEPTA